MVDGLHQRVGRAGDDARRCVIRSGVVNAGEGEREFVGAVNPQGRPDAALVASLVETVDGHQAATLGKGRTESWTFR